MALAATVGGNEKSGSDMSPQAPRSKGGNLDALIAALDSDDLRVIVGKAAESHEEVARSVRLAAKAGREISVSFGRRSKADCGPAGSWVTTKVVVGRTRCSRSSRRSAARSGRRQLPSWCSSSNGRSDSVVKVILHADDSDGFIGDVARELLDLHAEACDAGVADTINLARWMVKFGFDDPGFL